VSAESIARTLGGVRNGAGWLCRCPCPSHGQGRGDRRPSLSVKDGDRVLLVRCFAGCTASEVLTELRRLGLLEEAGRVIPENFRSYQPRPAVPDHAPDPEALALWHKAAAVAGTLGEAYLAARGLRAAPPTLRFLECVNYNAHLARPVMVAAVQAPDRRVIAVQLTFLDPRGNRKAQVAMPRKTIGALGWGTVRLARATDELGLAEGTESALAAMQLTNVPCWASLGAQRMHRVAVPDKIRCLHIFADNDDAGRSAAERTAHAHQGREVTIRFPPPEANDYADLLRERTSA
jgi:putative DNA primase/helicase